MLAQGLILSRLLGPHAIGLYGIVSVTVTSFLLLKRVGIDEAFVQQDEDEQEIEFQRAFTLELIVSALFSLLIAISAPILAVVYGDTRLLFLTLATTYLPLALALQSPSWVFFRRMDFMRQRRLQAIIPIVTFAVAVPLAAAGVGVWSLIIGPFAGNVAGIAAAVWISPYRLGLHLDRATARRYLQFTVPVFLAALGQLIIAQGQILAFDLHSGLAGAGFITLAVTLTRYADRADQIVASTIYPVACAIQGRTAQLAELFSKSNRATLLWVLPFAGGIVLFAPDLPVFVIGRKWEPAVLLLQGLAVATALGQIGFNWFSFYRAHRRTREPAIEALFAAAMFCFLALPGLVIWGVWGFLAGRILGMFLMLVLRAYYVRNLLPSIRLVPLVLRSGRALAFATVAVLALRLGAWGGERTLVQAALEVAVFLGVYTIAAVRLERDLVTELRRSWGLGRMEARTG